MLYAPSRRAGVVGGTPNGSKRSGWRLPTARTTRSTRPGAASRAWLAPDPDPGAPRQRPSRAPTASRSVVWCLVRNAPPPGARPGAFAGRDRVLVCGLRINQVAITLVSMVTDATRLTRQRARLTRQGQITVPKAVRDALGARPGDEIEFVPRGEELLVEVRPRRSVLDFAGIAAEAMLRVPGTAEELDELVDRGMAEASMARERRTRRGSRQPG